MSRANSSLPVPLSASSRISAPLRAACRPCSSAASKAAELPMIGLLTARLKVEGLGPIALGSASGRLLFTNCALGNICLPLLHGACRLRAAQIRSRSREVTIGRRQRGDLATRQAQMLRKNRAALGENGSALDHMLQLAHIARPRVLFQQPDRLLRQHRVATLRLKLAQEMASQRFHVCAALRQRRQLNGKYRQAVEEV